MFFCGGVLYRCNLFERRCNLFSCCSFSCRPSVEQQNKMLSVSNFLLLTKENSSLQTHQFVELRRSPGSTHGKKVLSNIILP